MKSKEWEYHFQFADRVTHAAELLFGDQAVTHRIRGLVDAYQTKVDHILNGRGVPCLTVATVGAKGQGKSWVIRQFIKSPVIQSQIPSGVLGNEATTRLYWIGPASPESLDPSREYFLPCDASQLIDIGQNYMLLDTPGITDAERGAVEASRSVLSLAPIKLLVIRRDQLRASINSEIAAWIEGAVCIPIVTCIPMQELVLAAEGDMGQHSPTASLQQDIQHLTDWLRASAPQGQLTAPILVEDFEASGAEGKAGARLVLAVQERLRGQPLESLQRTRNQRLTATHHQLKRDVGRLVHQECPYLASAVHRLHEEADRLPLQVLDTIMGSSWILHAAVRGRLRSRLVADTSPLWFPFRSILSLLSLTQGAWDRLIFAFTGSVPSLFGTLVHWAKSFQQSQTASQEMQSGIRERLHGQVVDRLEPIHRQFHNALLRIKHGDQTTMQAEVPKVRLGGIEELQSQSRRLFEEMVDAQAVPSSFVQLVGLIGTLGFWGMMLGPIVSIYRRYFHASYESLMQAAAEPEHFPHNSASLVFTSALLSIIPIFLFAMIIMSFWLRGSKLRRIAQGVQKAHHQMLETLKRDGVLKLHFEDKALEEAEFLIQLERGLPEGETGIHGGN